VNSTVLILIKERRIQLSTEDAILDRILSEQVSSGHKSCELIDACNEKA